MSRFWRHFINNGAGAFSGPPADPNPEDDGEALDAYSRVVVRVAEALRDGREAWATAQTVNC